jgi:hypothetical protein
VGGVEVHMLWAVVPPALRLPDRAPPARQLTHILCSCMEGCGASLPLPGAFPAPEERGGSPPGMCWWTVFVWQPGLGDGPLPLSPAPPPPPPHTHTRTHLVCRPCISTHSPLSHSANDLVSGAQKEVEEAEMQVVAEEVPPGSARASARLAQEGRLPHSRLAVPASRWATLRRRPVRVDVFRSALASSRRSRSPDAHSVLFSLQRYLRSMSVLVFACCRW